MIFFSGWGILTPMFAILGIFIAAAADVLFTSDGTVSAVDANRYAILVGGGIASYATWKFGSWLNDSKRDPTAHDKNGKEVIARRRHTLMFIPVEYYGFLYAAITLFILFGNNPK